MAILLPPMEAVGTDILAVLPDAPAWWSLAVEGKLRKWLWVALRDDAPGVMEAALRTYSWGAATRNHPERVGWDLDKLLVRLRLALWAKSAGKGAGGKRRGLLHAAACNVLGVPGGGAPRCVERLLKLSPPGRGELWQLRVAVRDAQSLGRQEIVDLLRPHIERLEAGPGRLRHAVGALLLNERWALAAAALSPAACGPTALTAAICVFADALMGEKARAPPPVRQRASVEALVF